MKSERVVIQQVIELAQEIKEREIYLKLEEEKCISDEPEEIQKRNEKLANMRSALNSARYAMRIILDIFEA